MLIQFDTNSIKSSIPIGEFIFLLTIVLADYPKKSDIEDLKSKGFISIEEKDGNKNVKLTKEGKKFFWELMESKAQSQNKIRDYEDLAEKLIELYPKGRKEGTFIMWRDSKPNIARRLRTLKEKYNIEFTDEQAIEVTKKYVSSFNGNFKTMRVLKYFLYKLENKDGNIEFNSDFSAYIENMDNLEMEREDWQNTLV